MYNFIDSNLYNAKYTTQLRTRSFFNKHFTNIIGYYRIFTENILCSFKIKSLSNKEEQFITMLSCIHTLFKQFEDIGMTFFLEGLDNTRKCEPSIILANHMSSMETFFLGLLAGTDRKVSFVAKRSLIRYPIFKNIISLFDPVLVDRVNPREDFKVIMKEGQRVLDSGRHIIIFPQATRKQICVPEDFSSIAIKLARSTSAPVIPLALKTDALGVGKYIRDIGRIRAIPVHYKFFTPFTIESASGKEEQLYTTSLICTQVKEWQAAENNFIS
ncbi:MAG: lysophospholipid acyltransferase family protein [Desulfovibrionaceae bacterium]